MPPSFPPFLALIFLTHSTLKPYLDIAPSGTLHPLWTQAPSIPRSFRRLSSPSVLTEVFISMWAFGTTLTLSGHTLCLWGRHGGCIVLALRCHIHTPVCQIRIFLRASCQPTSLLPNPENCPLLAHWIIRGVTLSIPLLFRSSIILRDFSVQADNWLDCYFLDLFNTKGLHLHSASAIIPRPHLGSCQDSGMGHSDSSNLLYGCILPIFWWFHDLIPMIPVLWPPRNADPLSLPFPSVNRPLGWKSRPDGGSCELPTPVPPFSLHAILLCFPAPTNSSYFLPVSVETI